MNRMFVKDFFPDFKAYHLVSSMISLAGFDDCRTDKHRVVEIIEF